MVCPKPWIFLFGRLQAKAMRKSQGKAGFTFRILDDGGKKHLIPTGKYTALLRVLFWSVFFCSLDPAM